MERRAAYTGVCDGGLNTPYQKRLLAVLVLTFKGSAGVAGTGLLALAATPSALHSIPAVAFHRAANLPQAMVNATGFSLADTAIAEWERSFNASRGNAVNRRPLRAG